MRAAEVLAGTFHYLDLTVFGRQETFENSPEGWPRSDSMMWIRRHDEYEVS